LAACSHLKQKRDTQVSIQNVVVVAEVVKVVVVAAAVTVVFKSRLIAAVGCVQPPKAKKKKKKKKKRLEKPGLKIPISRSRSKQATPVETGRNPS